ncbi:uncharacterized protein PV09_03876 [Verruconis gallopava]|uniref:thioredoxin-dependent peroxiredoxin n=1 Tax=Verruconis gallopava TaxID=253628 RepID=A0A0D2AFT5_9PEZI|nr:uncharacterized protein PV09_03876 [Verruconis gallopava]KIW05360.1 hypothetical protein PV09_03876 [Verruconis gallopava]
MSDRVLRKRPAAPTPAEPPAKKAAPKPKNVAAKVVDSVKSGVAKASANVEAKATGEKTSSAGGAPQVGDVIDVASFGGEFETNDGKKVTLKELLDESKSGIVLFTYPKASTPGCTTQACLFRDGHETLTSTGYTIYGLSGDSPKANTTFKTKQKLPYTLLCNPSYSLIGAIGMQDKPAKKTKRGVFALDKSGKVVIAQRGGPQATVDAVKEMVDSAVKGDSNKAPEDGAETPGAVQAAETAGEVADAARAAHLDETPQVGTPA